MSQVKDYLGTENARNKRHAQLFTDIIKAAFGDCPILIGHHLTFEPDAQLDSENEIPSADTLIFDHGVMTRVFGDQAIPFMEKLARTPVELRDHVLEALFQLRRKPICAKEPYIIEPRTHALLQRDIAVAYEEAFSASITTRSAPDTAPELKAADGRSAFDEVAMERWADDGGPEMQEGS